MGKNILTKLNHYKLPQLVLLAVVLRLVDWLTCQVWITKNDLIISLDGPILAGIHLLATVIWLAAAILTLQIIIYSDKTQGRSYLEDRRRYGWSWIRLVEFYKDADPCRLDISELPAEDWREAEGIIFGKVGDRLVKRPSDGVGNCAVFSLPGGGKTTSQIIPSALRFDGSVLAIDIKGDILHYTEGNRKIKVFNPDQAAGSCHFNPLAGIEDMTASERRVYLEQLASVIIPTEPDGAYFSDGGRDFFCGISLYLLQTDVSVTLPEIARAIMQGDAFSWVKRIRDSDCADAKEYLNSYYGSNEKNVSGCFNMASKCVRPFVSGSLAELLDGEGDCISPEALEAGFDVYIELPQDKIQVYSPVTTIIVQSFMTAFMRRPDRATGDQRRPILFLLDEFPQLQFDFDTLTAGLSTLRSKGVTLFLAAQSIAQLNKRYGDTGAREIIDTIAYISMLSAQDPQSREFFQRLIGTKKVLKVSTSSGDKSSSRGIQEARELVFQAEELGNLGDDVIIYANGKYVRAQKVRCYE